MSNIIDASTLNQSEYDMHQFWMRQAIEQARVATAVKEVPIGAVIVVNQTLMGVGFNQPIGLSNPCAHAEIQALQAAATKMKNYRLLDADLYVTLEPCTMCFGAMIHARIRRLIYGAAEPKAGALTGCLNLHENTAYNHQMTIISGVEKIKCSEEIQRFFHERRQEKKGLKRSMNH